MKRGILLATALFGTLVLSGCRTIYVDCDLDVLGGLIRGDWLDCDIYQLPEPELQESIQLREELISPMEVP